MGIAADKLQEISIPKSSFEAAKMTPIINYTDFVHIKKMENNSCTITNNVPSNQVGTT